MVCPLLHSLSIEIGLSQTWYNIERKRRTPRDFIGETIKISAVAQIGYYIRARTALFNCPYASSWWNFYHSYRDAGHRSISKMVDVHSLATPLVVVGIESRKHINYRQSRRLEHQKYIDQLLFWRKAYNRRYRRTAAEREHRSSWWNSSS